MHVQFASTRRQAHGSRLLAVLTLIAASVSLTATPAAAHAVLIASSPTSGDSIGSVPTEVSLTFDENVAEPAFVVVSAPDGSDITVGDPSVSDNVVTQAVDPVDEKGVYTFAYRIVSADGHPVSDTLTFTVTNGRDVGQVEPGTTDAAPHEHESFWTHHRDHLIIGALVAAAALWLLFGGRRAKARSADR